MSDKEYQSGWDKIMERVNQKIHTFLNKKEQDDVKEVTKEAKSSKTKSNHPKNSSSHSYVSKPTMKYTPSNSFTDMTATNNLLFMNTLSMDDDTKTSQQQQHHHHSSDDFGSTSSHSSHSSHSSYDNSSSYSHSSSHDSSSYSHDSGSSSYDSGSSDFGGF